VAMNKFRQRARQLKGEVTALYFAMRHPRTPWFAKVLGGCVVAYALSPIDLIPDFIPVIGLLDDLILVPAGIALTLRMIPKDVIEECKAQAAKHAERPRSLVGAAVIVCVWLILVALSFTFLWRRFRR